MGDALRVERCDRSRLEALREVAERSFRETYAELTAPEEMERHVGEAFSPDTIDQELATPGCTFYLAIVEGAVAGFMKLNRGSAQTELREKSGLEIESLYVLREFQGRGVGQALLDRALEEARDHGAACVWLGVWERNESGRRFWQRQGFVEFGSHPFLFAGAEHRDLMMRRPLEGAQP